MHISFSREKDNNCDLMLKTKQQKDTLVYFVSQADHSSRFCKKFTLSKLSLSVVIKIYLRYEKGFT